MLTYIKTIVGHSDPQWCPNFQRINMRVILLTLIVIGCALAEEAPYPPSGYRPQGALLLLPSRQNNAQVQPAETETLEKVGETIMERLRQQDGSNTGEYYIYLPDGRLQKVQYTSAPFKTSPDNNNQQVQNTQAFQNSNTLQFNQQNAQANSRFQFPGQFGQLREQYQFGQSAQQINSQYGVPRQGAGQQTPYNQNQPNAEPFQPESNGQSSNQYSRVSVQGPEQGINSDAETVNPIVAQFGKYQYDQQQRLQQQQQQQQQISSWLASVQYTDVQPIPAPIYSFSPAPLVRILRYAPRYQ